MLPTFVAPQPNFGLAADGGFQALHEIGRELPIGNFAGVVAHQLKGGFIVAATFPLYIKVDESGIEFFANSLRTCEAGGVLMEKIYPFVDVDGFGTLIGDKATNHLFPFRFEAENLAQNEVLINVVRTKMTAKLQKELVEEVITDGFVKLAGINAFTKPDTEGRNPFPVAIMAEINEDKVVVVEEGFHLVDIGENHAPAYFARGHGKELERFKNVVAEIVVETIDEAVSLLWRLLRKGARNIAAHHAKAVAHHVANEKK